MYLRRLLTLYLIEPKQESIEEVAKALTESKHADTFQLCRVVDVPNKKEVCCVFSIPTNAAGTSCQQANHTIWTSGSATYRQVGQGKNVISLGFLVHFIWDRET